MPDPTDAMSDWRQRAETYWVESRRPLASLVFVAPLLIVYEVGVLRFGVPQTGANAFLQRLLEPLGLGEHLVAPLLVICVLLAWHYLARQPWQLSGPIISTMAVESFLLGFFLRIVALVQNAILSLGIGKWVQNAVGYLGAGIYEELLFRLMLLPLLAWAFHKAGAKPRLSTILAVVVSSVLFAAAHHVGPYGEDAHWQPFLFRTIAGLFFAVIYLYRGFGIAAGAHAVYDILVGVF